MSPLSLWGSRIEVAKTTCGQPLRTAYNKSFENPLKTVYTPIEHQISLASVRLRLGQSLNRISDVKIICLVRRCTIHHSWKQRWCDCSKSGGLSASRLFGELLHLVCSDACMTALTLWNREWSNTSWMILKYAGFRHAILNFA